MNAIIVTIFQRPIMLLNIFGVMGSAIWLLVIGKWASVVNGIIASMIGHFLLFFLLPLGFLFAAPMAWALRRGIAIGVYFFGFLLSVYTYFVISVWCRGVIINSMEGVSAGAFWPMLIWSYGVATSPLTYMAWKDNGIAAHMAAFFMQAAYIVMMVAMAFGADLTTGAQAFYLVVIVGIFFHMQIFVEMRRALNSTE